MCGRFTQTEKKAEALTERFGAILSERTDKAEVEGALGRYNVAPTQNIPAIVAPEGKRELRLLRWCVAGCLEWQAHGLGDADAVERATREYREDEDTLGAFLSERCILGKGCEVSAADLRVAYENYCDQLGESPLSASVLGQQLRKRGISKGGAGRRSYQGVMLG